MISCDALTAYKAYDAVATDIDAVSSTLINDEVSAEVKNELV